MSALLVDLHDERPEPDWNELAGFGVVGAYLKLGEGTSSVGGQRAPSRATRARAAGLFVGFYWFARPDLGHTPRVEAQAFAGRLSSVQRSSDLRPALDLERGLPGKVADVASSAAWGAKVLDVLAELGYPRSAWYASASPAAAMRPLYHRPAWIAGYGPNDGRKHPLPPLPGVSVLLHQFTSAGGAGSYRGDLSYFTDGRIARMLSKR